MTSKAYILIGVPGSGKSTWAFNQPWAKDCAYISTDKHVEDYARHMGKTYSEVFEEYMPTALEFMLADVVNARDNGKDIIWDQTSTTIASRKRKFNMLPDYYHVAVVFKTPPMTELSKRLNGRPGKEVPMSVVNMMISLFETPTDKEGYKEIWYVN